MMAENRQQSQAPRIRQPDPYAQDAGLAAALAMNSPQADTIQQAQNSQSASMARMTTPTAPSSPAGAGSEDVWVTVPVDKVSVAKGKGTVTPVYAAGSGYRDPKEGAAVPPTVKTTRPPV